MTNALPRTIETDRLTLRPLRPEDAGPITLFAGDARVARVTASIPHPYPPGAAAAFIERADAGRLPGPVWALDGSKSDASGFIGLIGLTKAEGGDDLGFWIGPPFWRQGYATEAARAVAEAAAAAGRRLVARAGLENAGSIAVLRAAGFEETGTGEAYSLALGETRPVRLFACDAETKG